MNLDPATRASVMWRVMAAAVNALGDAVPAWEALSADITSMVVRSGDAIAAGVDDPTSLSTPFAMAGWEMGRWNEAEKTCVFAEMTRGPGLVAWHAGVAALTALKEI